MLLLISRACLVACHRLPRLKLGTPRSLGGCLVRNRSKARHTLATVFYVNCAACFSSASATASSLLLLCGHPAITARPFTMSLSAAATGCTGPSTPRHSAQPRTLGGSELKMTAGHGCCLVLARPLLVRVPSGADHIPSGGVELDSYLRCVSSGDRRWRMKGHGERAQRQQLGRRPWMAHAVEAFGRGERE